MSMPQSNPEYTQLFLFEINCPKCRKIREVHIKQDVVGSKDLDVIECICGFKLSVNSLRYLYKNKGYIEQRLQYFIY